MERTKSVCDELRTGDTVRIGSKYYTLEVANTFMSRFLGLMGRKNLASDKAMFIKPCNSIHTFFMRFDMTAVFVDRDMRVIKIVPDMKPWKMAFAPKAYAVFEISSENIVDANVGDTLSDVFLRTKEEVEHEDNQVPFFLPVAYYQ